MTIALAAFGAALGGCGNSPLLNHQTATASPNGESKIEHQDLGEKGECPIVFASSKLCAALKWTKLPRSRSPGDFELSFWRKDGGSKDGPYTEPAPHVRVFLWMPHMGHGSDPVELPHMRDSLTGEPVAGRFEAKRVKFTMPGAWDIHILLSDENKTIEEFILPIKI